MIGWLGTNDVDDFKLLFCFSLLSVSLDSSLLYCLLDRSLDCLSGDLDSCTC